MVKQTLVYIQAHIPGQDLARESVLIPVVLCISDNPMLIIIENVAYDGAT